METLRHYKKVLMAVGIPASGKTSTFTKLADPEDLYITRPWDELGFTLRQRAKYLKDSILSNVKPGNTLMIDLVIKNMDELKTMVDVVNEYCTYDVIVVHYFTPNVENSLKWATLDGAAINIKNMIRRMAKKWDFTPESIKKIASGISVVKHTTPPPPITRLE